jgi:hypothetical protein
MVCCTATSSREENSATEPDLLRQDATELSDSHLAGSSGLRSNEFVFRRDLPNQPTKLRTRIV